MPRPKMPPKQCSEPGCDRTTTARGLCPLHYNRVLRAENGPKPKGWPTTIRREIRPVVADAAWPDPHPRAPSGQRNVFWTCPNCGKAHLSSWLPVDHDPGLKLASCTRKASSGTANNPLFDVLKPPPDRIFTSFQEYEDFIESQSSTNGRLASNATSKASKSSVSLA